MSKRKFEVGDEVSFREVPRLAQYIRNRHLRFENLYKVTRVIQDWGWDPKVLYEIEPVEPMRGLVLNAKDFPYGTRDTRRASELEHAMEVAWE